MFFLDKTFLYLLLVIATLGVCLIFLGQFGMLRANPDIGGTDYLLRHRHTLLVRLKNGDTTHWITYRNEDYGFEVKYPSLYQLLENEISASETYKEGISVSVKSEYNDSLTIGVNLRDYGFCEESEELVNKDVAFMGTQAKHIRCADTSGHVTESYRLQRGEQDFEIRFGYPENMPNQKNTWYTILSTFKFTQYHE